jgi:hypothetical protein
MGGRILAVRGWLPLVFALAVTGCGGSGIGSSQVHGVGAGFGAKALSACASAQESKDRWSDFPAPDFDPTRPDEAKLPQVGAWLESQVAPTFDAWLADLTALGKPPTGRRAWTEVLTLVRKIDDLNRVQVQAAKGGDTHAFADATHALKDLQPELERATAAAGVGKCAEVHAG